MPPEVWANAAAWLPDGIVVESVVTHGGAKRVDISGKKVKAGKAYQLVVVNEPMRRVIELVENPHQDG